MKTKKGRRVTYKSFKKNVWAQYEKAREYMNCMSGANEYLLGHKIEVLPGPTKTTVAIKYKGLKDFYENAKPGEVLKINLRR